MTTNEGHLAGLTVLELAGLGPVIRCGRALADLGARWVRVVRPGVDPSIDIPWYCYGGSDGVETVSIDLTSSAGRSALLALAARSDVLLEGMRPGAAQRLGVSFEDVAVANPAIVYCSISGYGQTGPYAARVGHDLNYVAAGGGLALAGIRADGAPALPGLTLADSAGGGWHAALRVMAALLARERTGTGAYLDVAVAEGVVDLMSLPLDETLATGSSPRRRETVLTGQFACYDVYATADGRWLTVGAIEPKFFRNLCVQIGLEEWVERQYEPAAQDELRRRMSETFRQKPLGEWMADLGPVDCCVAPVLDLPEVLDDAHWRARGVFAGYDHPARGRQTRVRALGRDSEPATPPARELEHTLRAFGMSPDEAAEVLSSGGVSRPDQQEVAR